MPVNANYRERDPDCDLNLVLEAPRRQPRADDAVQFVRLRRLEQLHRAAPSRSRRERCVAARLRGQPRHRAGTDRVSSSPAPAPSAGPGATPRRCSTPIVEGRSAIASDHAVGHDRLAGARTPRNRRFQRARARRRPQAAQAHPAHRHGRHLRRRPRRRSGRAIARIATRWRRPRPTFADRTGVYVGLGRRRVREPVRLFSADERGERRPCGTSAASSPTPSTRCGCCARCPTTCCATSASATG